MVPWFRGSVVPWLCLLVKRLLQDDAKTDGHWATCKDHCVCMRLSVVAVVVEVVVVAVKATMVELVIVLVVVVSGSGKSYQR